MENNKIKTFSNHFDMLLKKLKSNEHFAYCRFSDGELFIMQNKELELGADKLTIGNQVSGGKYEEEDRKHFIPNKRWINDSQKALIIRILL